MQKIVIKKYTILEKKQFLVKNLMENHDSKIRMKVNKNVFFIVNNLLNGHSNPTLLWGIMCKINSMLDLQYTLFVCSVTL